MRLLLASLVIAALAIPTAALAERAASGGASATTTSAVSVKHEKKSKKGKKGKKGKKAKRNSTSADEREVKGTISALSATSITVGQLTCAVPPTISLSSFRVGDFVEMKCDRVQGAWRLRKIHHEDDNDNNDDDEREVKGLIQALSSSSITVGNLTCAVPSTVSLTGFQVGHFVEITCDLVRGTWTLRKLKHEDDDNDNDEREVKGTISALSAGSITVGSLTCKVPAGMSLGSFAVGHFVELKCDLIAGTWTVRKVEHEDDDDDDDDDDDRSGSNSGSDDDDDDDHDRDDD